MTKQRQHIVIVTLSTPRKPHRWCERFNSMQPLALMLRKRCLWARGTCRFVSSYGDEVLPYTSTYRVRTTHAGHPGEKHREKLQDRARKSPKNHYILYFYIFLDRATRIRHQFPAHEYLKNPLFSQNAHASLW